MTVRSYLSSRVPREPLSDDDLQPMRLRAWREQGILTIRPEEIDDEIERRFLQAIAERFFGPRDETAARRD